MNKNVEAVRIVASLLLLLIAIGKSQAGIYGFGVNWDSGSAYMNELFVIDATSGEMMQVVGTYPDIYGHSASSLDPASGRLYKIITTKSDGTSRLYTIDLRTGTLLSSPTIDMGDSNRTLQELYVFDGALYGFGKYSSGSTYNNELYAMDASSGKMTQVLGAYPDIYAYAAFASPVDLASGRLYKIITTKSDGTSRLYTIDLRTGALLSSPTIDMGDSNRTLQELYVFDGALYGFGKYSSGSTYTNELYVMDATSGKMTQVLGAYPDIYGHSAGSLNPESGRLYKSITAKSDGTMRLYTIDLRTGALLSSPTIDLGNPNRTLQELYALPTISTVIKANGQIDNVTISNSDNLSITVQLDPGEYSGQNADWWIIACAGSSWYYLNSSIQWTLLDGNLSNCHPVYQGALFNLPVTEVLNISNLPTGAFTFWFAVDQPMDGILNINGLIWFDSVNVTVQ